MPSPFSRSLSRHAVLVAALALVLTGCEGDSAPQGGAEWAAPVTVITARKGSAQVEQTYAGRVRGAREVEVRTRVQGILEKRLHEEGGRVERGEPLFRIDPEPFTVALQAARAEEQSAAADLSQAEREWRRISRLYEQDAVSQRERDNARSALEQAEARMALAKSRTAQAQLELRYTRVEAPLSGVTSLEALSEGSLVERGTLLTTIVQHDPVQVRFSIPEEDAALQRSARSAVSGRGNSDHRREASLVLPGGALYERSGEIDFTAATVDPATGTVSVRAVFPNPDNRLIPGQFVRVRMLLQSLDDVVVVPPAVVVQGPEGQSLYVVDEDNRAELRRVTLGPLTSEGQVVLEGVGAGERVVTNGQVGLRPGMAVHPREAGAEEEG